MGQFECKSLQSSSFWNPYLIRIFAKVRNESALVIVFHTILKGQTKPWLLNWRGKKANIFHIIVWFKMIIWNLPIAFICSWLKLQLMPLPLSEGILAFLALPTIQTLPWPFFLALWMNRAFWGHQLTSVNENQVRDCIPLSQDYLLDPFKHKSQMR